MQRVAGAGRSPASSRRLPRRHSRGGGVALRGLRLRSDLPRRHRPTLPPTRARLQSHPTRHQLRSGPRRPFTQDPDDREGTDGVRSSIGGKQFAVRKLGGIGT